MESADIGWLDPIAYSYFSINRPHKKAWTSVLLKVLNRKEYMILIYIIQVYVISADFERWEENVPFEQIMNLVKSIYLSQRLEVI